MRRNACLCIATCGVWLLLVGPSRAAVAGNPARGKVLFALAAGCNCHTSKHGPLNAGGGEVPTPFGKFYGPNITPDPETGIGHWSDAEIAAAIRDGWVRGKGAESPAMPYNYYAGMADQDVADLIAYLRSLPPVRQPNKPFEGQLPLARWAYRGWRLLFFHPPVAPAHAPASGIARGRYLVNHVSLCADCHTPRNFLGVPKSSLYLAGNAYGPDGESVPNITPHGTGIKTWDVTDILNVLTMGMLPDFDNVQGAMAEMVDGRGGGPGYKDAPKSDLRDIADYLKTVAPIDNAVHRK